MPYGKKNKYFPFYHIHKLFISYATISYNVSVEKYIGVLKSWVVLNYKVLSCRMNQFNKNLFFSRQGLEILIEHSFHNLLFYLIVSILKVKKCVQWSCDMSFSTFVNIGKKLHSCVGQSWKLWSWEGRKANQRFTIRPRSLDLP